MPSVGHVVYAIFVHWVRRANSQLQLHNATGKKLIHGPTAYSRVTWKSAKMPHTLRNETVAETVSVVLSTWQSKCLAISPLSLSIVDLDFTICVYFVMCRY